MELSIFFILTKNAGQLLKLEISNKHEELVIPGQKSKNTPH